MHVYDDRQGSRRVSEPVFSVSVAAKLFVSAARAGARAHHAGSRFDLSVPQPPDRQLLNGLKNKTKTKQKLISFSVFFSVFFLSRILIVTFSMLQNTLCGNYRVRKKLHAILRAKSACS